ncbi:uncharacterized protein METZ01_LOCUS216543, partial [marine metagenome]
VRKAFIIAILILMPGCLDTTPEEISGIQIQLPIGSVIEGDSATFAVSGQKPNGAKYLWDFGDGSGGTGENVQHIFVEEGQYTIVLTVIDAEGRIGVASENIEILHRNEFPIASLYSTYGGEGQTIKVNSLVLFDGGSSSDPDGDVLTFEWDFGDGNAGVGIRPNHFYETIGNFTVTLVVSDNGNLSSTAQTWVLVSMRTFSVFFTEHTITIPVLAGYTAEGGFTPLTHNYPYNLTNANYNLEWTEDEALDSEDNPIVGTLFPDNFSLSVATNYLVNLTDTGTSGNLELGFVILNEIPTDLILSLGSIEDTNQYLFENGYTSAKGQGQWLTTITCNNAPSIIPELLSNVDEGNDWFLNVDYQYYSATIIEL